MADIKNFLYVWCGKKKTTPNYDIRAAGNKNRQKFMCEVRQHMHMHRNIWVVFLVTGTHKILFSLKVRVEGYSYIGMGNSTNKKDAQTNAARDFVNYLVRTKEINASDVPSLGVSATVHVSTSVMWYS